VEKATYDLIVKKEGKDVFQRVEQKVFRRAVEGC
jgi:hypothetical protein